jgi:hypothetical protein
MHRVCGRAQASTNGGLRAPFELGEDVEREARPLCIRGLHRGRRARLQSGQI